MPELVTIITLTYKKFDTVFAAIDSVLAQDYPAIEYIVADDGSAKFPRDEIRNYIFNHKKANVVNVKVIHQTTNVGTVKNFNLAIKNSSGKYIIPLSNDDVFYDNKVVSRIVNYFHEHDCNVICGCRVAIDSQNNEVGFMPHRRDQKTIMRWITEKQQREAFVGSRFRKMASGSAMYYRKQTLDAMGLFDENYRLWEDGPFIERFTRTEKIAAVYNTPAIKYKLGGISTGDKSVLLIKDEELFNTTDRLIDIQKLPFFDRRTVLYDEQRILQKNKTLLKIKNIDVLLRRKYYTIIDRIGWFSDRRYLKNIENKKARFHLCK